MHTGRRWRWQAPAGCRTQEFAQAPQVLVAAVECDGGGTKVIGLSAVDGVQRWVWQPPSGGVYGGTVAVVGDTVRVMARAHGDFTLDAATGVVRHPELDARPPTSFPEEIPRGPEATVYLDTHHTDTHHTHTHHTDPGITAVDAAGATRWMTPVPELAGAKVSNSAVDGGIGYALLVADSSAVAWHRRLFAFDLASGAVLTDREVRLPDECRCTVVSQRAGQVVLLPGSGALAVAYATTSEPWAGVTVYA